MFPRTSSWVRAAAVVFGIIGFLFLTLGLLSGWAVYAGTTGSTRVVGRIMTVVPPTNSTDSVHLLVRIVGTPSPLRVTTSSEDPHDYAIGNTAAVLIKADQDPALDDGSGRYTGSLVAAGGGLIALIVGLILWRNRGRLVPQSPAQPDAPPPMTSRGP